MANRISQSRWYLKKAARRGLVTVAWASGYLAAKARIAAGRRALLAQARRVRVLTYHRFGDSTHDPFCVTRHDFENQMRWLADNQLAVSLLDLEEFLAGSFPPGKGEKDLAAGKVLVTVDDGFRSVFTEMLPVLQEYAIPAVAYVAPGMIRGRAGSSTSHAPSAAGSEAYLTWDELQRLAAGGVVIGSHGWAHRSLGRMGPAEARHEAARSRETLEQRLGSRVTSLAYPYGTRADFSSTTANVLAEAGYTTAFTSRHGAITTGANPLELPRIKVEGGDGPWMFRLLCRGAMDGWRLVDRALWRVQHAGT